LSPLSCLHIGVAVPQSAIRFVGQIFVNGGNTRFPHIATIRVTAQKPTPPEILRVRINTSATLTVRCRPGAGLGVYNFPREAKRRASAERFHQRLFCFFVENALAS